MSSRSLAVMPQDTRLMAFFLGSVGGSLDVFSHRMFGTLIATQTGNIILLVADWGSAIPDKTISSVLSLVFFTIGFLMGIRLKDCAKTAFWRVIGIIPLLVTSFLYPFFPDYPLIWIALLAASAGMMMLTFTGTKIEDHAYVIMMTSGNYRKMVTAWYRYLTQKDDRSSIKRQAINYTIVVGSFVGAAILTGLLVNLIGAYALWVVSAALLEIIIIYVTLVKAYHLELRNR